MTAGTGTNTDAAIIANSGTGAVTTVIGVCSNCEILDFDPLADPGAQTGFFGIATISSAEVPQNQQVIVLNDYSQSDPQMLVVLYEEEEEEEEEILECR